MIGPIGIPSVSFINCTLEDDWEMVRLLQKTLIVYKKKKRYFMKSILERRLKIIMVWISD